MLELEDELFDDLDESLLLDELLELLELEEELLLDFEESLLELLDELLDESLTSLIDDNELDEDGEL